MSKEDDNKENKKLFVALIGIETQTDCSVNEIKVFYNILTREEMNQIKNYSFYGVNKTEQLTNKIKLENPDPRLLYAIFKLLGSTGYTSIELKKEVG